MKKIMGYYKVNIRMQDLQNVENSLGRLQK